MKIIKNITTLALLLVALLVLSSSAQARSWDTSDFTGGGWVGYGGSTSPVTTVTLKAGRNVPISASYKLPDVYNVGVPTPIRVRLKYHSKMYGNWGSKKRPKWIRYKKIFGNKAFQVSDFKGGATLTTSQAVSDDAELYRLGSNWYDVPIRSIKKFRLWPNKARTITMWVTFDRCYAWPVVTTAQQQLELRIMTGFDTPPVGYPCVFASQLNIKWEAKISRRKGKNSYSTSTRDGFGLSQIPLMSQALPIQIGPTSGS